MKKFLLGMKSLRESLFDRDLVTKDVKFSDIFELVHNKNLPYLFQEVGSHSWSKYLSSVRIKKDMKVTGGTPSEIIYEGILKLINNIKFTSKNMTTDLFEEYLTKLFHPYYQWSNPDKYKRAYVQIYKNNRFIIGQEQDMLIGDFDTINVYPCQGFCITFERK